MASNHTARRSSSPEYSCASVLQDALNTTTDEGLPCPPHLADRKGDGSRDILAKVFKANLHDPYKTDSEKDVQARATLRRLSRNCPDSGWPSGHGKAYEGLHTSGQARVHAGDSIVVNNFHGTVISSAHGDLIRTAGLHEQRAAVALVAAALITVLMETIIELLLLAKSSIANRQLPLQITSQTVLFEDAFGGFRTIDVLFTSDWTSFHCSLSRSFIKKRGFLRIACGNYRLVDRHRSQDVINPNQPPPFALVFQPGRHIRMSVHFEWSEIPYEECPRCKLKQQCILGEETTCSSCRFCYRGQVEESWTYARKHLSRVQEVDSDSDDGMGKSVRPKRLVRSPQEAPGDFNRISISKRPEPSRVPRYLPFFPLDASTGLLWENARFKYSFQMASHPRRGLSSTRPLRPDECFGLAFGDCLGSRILDFRQFVQLPLMLWSRDK